MKNPFAPLAALFLFCPALLSTAPVQAAPAASAGPSVRLPGHLVPDALRGAAIVGRKNPADAMDLALTLPLRDPAGLNHLLARQYAPGDPLFHHFLTPAEFAARFSPTQQSYDAVASFARAHGLRVTGTHPSRLLLDVAGPASAVEAAFGVQLHNYAAADGRLFHAPDRDPAVPVSLAGKISGVVGLQNASVRHSNLRQPSVLAHEVGSGPYNGLTPNDIKTAYSLNATSMTGKGRTLALYELDGYTASDIASYETYYSLPQIPLKTILVDGFDGVPGGGAGEVTLDIELMAAIAPGVSSILVYEAPNGGPGVVDCYQKIADDNLSKEISSSWGIAEDETDTAEVNAESAAFQQMASQGQSIYAAAGDTGAYDDGKTLSVDDPASQPFMVGVGGTALNVQSPGGAYVAESAWDEPNRTPPAGGGGGISAIWPLPGFQSAVTTLGSMTQRNVPDVSLDADPDASGYSIYFGGGFTIEGGTSCAAPLWAAFTALVNQQRAANSQPNLGFANPEIYQIAGSSKYLTAFHDVYTATNLYYPATHGYDNATGWGSFNGDNLLNLLAPPVVTGNPVASLTLTPSTVVGGLAATGTVTLSNPAPNGGATVTLSAASGPATVPAAVTLAAGATSADFPITTTAVTASVTDAIMASYSGGSQNATLTVTPPPAVITPISLTVSPASVGGGAPSVGTVTLSGPAPAGGLSVTLTSSAPAAATVPTTAPIPQGAVSATFPIKTVAVTTTVPVTLSAALNGGMQTAVLTVEAPTLQRITLTPTTVLGGAGASLALTLTYPAPAGGATITLTSDNPAAALPAMVLIPEGQMAATVAITTSAVAVTTDVNLTASYNSVTKKSILTVQAALLEGLSLAPATVIGGGTTVGTLTLGSAAPASGLTATIASSDPSASPQASLFVAPGALSASFLIPTSRVQAAATAKITVTLSGTPQSASLTVQPIQITTLALTPATVLAGTPSAGRITLNAPAPAGGLSVTLTSSTAAATVPAALTIRAGSATATFPIPTPHAGSTTISATLSGTPMTAKLTVTGAPGTSYPAGLNMLSAPYDYTGIGLDGLFGYTGVVLGTWQPAVGGYALTPTAPAEALHLGHGYWANLPMAVTLSSTGTPADPTHDYAIALSAGWNQIGQPWTTGETLDSLTVSAGGTAVPFVQASTAAPLLVSGLVYRYQPGTGTTGGSYVYVRSGDTLQPGLGYWVYAYQAVTLTVPRH